MPCVREANTFSMSRNKVAQPDVFQMPLHEQPGSMDDICHTTSLYEATLVGHNVDDVMEMCFNDTFKDLHGATEMAGWSVNGALIGITAAFPKLVVQTWGTPSSSTIWLIGEARSWVPQCPSIFQTSAGMSSGPVTFSSFIFLIESEGGGTPHC